MERFDLIPLPFYYSENVDFADETVTYRAPINIELSLPLPHTPSGFMCSQGVGYPAQHKTLLLLRSQSLLRPRGKVHTQ